MCRKLANYAQCFSGLCVPFFKLCVNYYYEMFVNNRFSLMVNTTLHDRQKKHPIVLQELHTVKSRYIEVQGTAG